MENLAESKPWEPNFPIGAFAGSLPFNQLKDDAHDDFEAIAPYVNRSRGEQLFLEGETTKRIFIICSGKAKLSVSSREGKAVILRVAGPGEILGLNAAMTNSPHETSAEPTEMCRMRAIKVSDFFRFLQKYPEASSEVTSCLLRDYRVVLNNICRLALPSTVAGRLASLLLEWMRTPHSHSSNQNRFIVTLTQEEIASMTNTSRETVSRVLHQFQQEKLISIKGASVTILQPQTLKEMAA